MNAEARSLFKQTTALVTETDAKVLAISNDIKAIKELCQQTPVVIPLTPVDTQERP